MAKTVQLPVKVESGKTTYAPGDKVPINKAFTQKDANAIIALHGPYVGGEKVAKPTAAETVEVKIADLEDPAVKAAIEEAVDVARAAAKVAYEEFTALPDEAADDAVDAALAKLAASLGIEG